MRPLSIDQFNAINWFMEVWPSIVDKRADGRFQSAWLPNELTALPATTQKVTSPSGLGASRANVVQEDAAIVHTLRTLRIPFGH
jgi:hypothetical protein